MRGSNFRSPCLFLFFVFPSALVSQSVDPKRVNKHLAIHHTQRRNYDFVVVVVDEKKVLWASLVCLYLFAFVVAVQ